MTTEADDLDYFRCVEEAFIRLRGAPLLLSPADWKTAMRWRELGMSAHFVVGALEEVFARRRARGVGKDTVNSLRYCSRQVEKAWSETRELLGPAARPAPAIEVADRLAGLRAALPGGWKHAGEIAGELARMSGDSEAVERCLAELDSKMLACAASDLSEEERSELSDRVEERLQVWSARLEPSELLLAAERLRSEEIRQHYSLPLLSLFG